MDASSKNGRRTVVGIVSTVFSYNPDEIDPLLQCRLSRSFGIVSSIVYRILPSRFIPKDKQESSRFAGERGREERNNGCFSFRKGVSTVKSNFISNPISKIWRRYFLIVTLLDEQLIGNLLLYGSSKPDSRATFSNETALRELLDEKACGTNGF